MFSTGFTLITGAYFSEAFSAFGTDATGLTGAEDGLTGVATGLEGAVTGLTGVATGLETGA